MPVLEIKQLDASHSEAQRINSSGACELLSTQKNTHTRLTRKTATNGVLLSILLSPVIFFTWECVRESPGSGRDAPNTWQRSLSSAQSPIKSQPL